MAAPVNTTTDRVKLQHWNKAFEELCDRIEADTVHIFHDFAALLELCHTYPGDPKTCVYDFNGVLQVLFNGYSIYDQVRMLETTASQPEIIRTTFLEAMPAIVSWYLLTHPTLDEFDTDQLTSYAAPLSIKDITDCCDFPLTTVAPANLLDFGRKLYALMGPIKFTPY